MKRCRYLFASLSIIACFVIAACSGTQQDVNKPVILKFWHPWGGYEGKALQSLVDEFNTTHKHIRVETSQFSIGDKLLASIAGGKPPDIATVWSYMVAPMGESGAFINLDKYYEKSGITADTFLPHVWEHGLGNGHRWGVPTTLGALAIFYNTKVLQEVGIDPTVPPKSVKELEDWSKRLTRRDNNGRLERIGYVPTETDVWFWNFGARAYNEKTKHFELDTPQNAAALNWMKSLIDNVGGMAVYRRFTASYGKLDSPENPLLTGKLAMKEDGQWVTQFFANFAPTVEYGLFPYPPVNEGGESYTKLDGSFWVIPTGTSHPDEAWEFLEWLTAPRQNSRFCVSLLNIPPRKDTLNEPEFIEIRKNEKFNFFVKMVEEGKARPVDANPIQEQYVDKLEHGSQQAWGGSISAESMLKSLNESLNQELKRNKILSGSAEE